MKTGQHNIEAEGFDAHDGVLAAGFDPGGYTNILWFSL